jgi:thioredoxin-like negative regulator of GroEL
VVTVDATRRPELAGAFRIRSAPTALLADAAGAVLTRLVGPEAVAAYASASTSTEGVGTGR